MNSINYVESIPVAGKYDILVAGGGVAGIAAALAAARAGKSVLLMEKQTWLGGLATSGLINLWVPLCDGQGRLVIRGIAEELLNLSMRYGYDTLPEEWKEGEPPIVRRAAGNTRARCVSKFSKGMFALSVLKLLRDNGVKILYDCLISAPLMEKGHCKGLIVDGKSGRQFYEGGIVIDATGDADVLLRAGVPTVDGKNYMTYIAEGVTLRGCEEAVRHGDIRYAFSVHMGENATLHGDGHPEGEPLFEGCSMEMVNEYLQRNQLIMLEREADRPRKERDIHILPGMAQLRTSRRLDGNATFTEADLFKHHETSIGTICDFEISERLYEVPYGVLVRDGFDNLMTCGRSASASGWGWDVLRVIPPAVLTGQAAGTAAAVALDTRCAVADAPVEEIQKRLGQTGVIIHYNEV